MPARRSEAPAARAPARERGAAPDREGWSRSEIAQGHNGDFRASVNTVKPRADFCFIDRMRFSDISSRHFLIAVSATVFSVPFSFFSDAAGQASNASTAAAHKND